MTTDSFSSPDNLIEDSSSSSSLTGKSSCDWIRVDRTIAHIGKVKRDSKRRISWVLQHRPTETLVRIVLLWSLKSGKFSITVNDVEEVWEQRHNSSSTNSLLDHSFTPRAIVFKEQPPQKQDVSHSYHDDDDSDDTTTNDTTTKDMSSLLLSSTKIRIVAAKMVPSRTPFIQYDLMIDGVKFHHMPGNCPLPDEGLPSLADVVVVVASGGGSSSSR